MNGTFSSAIQPHNIPLISICRFFSSSSPLYEYSTAFLERIGGRDVHARIFTLKLRCIYLYWLKRKCTTISYRRKWIRRISIEKSVYRKHIARTESTSKLKNNLLDFHFRRQIVLRRYDLLRIRPLSSLSWPLIVIQLAYW